MPYSRCISSTSIWGLVESFSMNCKMLGMKWFPIRRHSRLLKFNVFEVVKYLLDGIISSMLERYCPTGVVPSAIKSMSFTSKLPQSFNTFPLLDDRRVWKENLFTLEICSHFSVPYSHFKFIALPTNVFCDGSSLRFNSHGFPSLIHPGFMEWQVHSAEHHCMHSMYGWSWKKPWYHEWSWMETNACTKPIFKNNPLWLQSCPIYTEYKRSR